MIGCLILVICVLSLCCCRVIVLVMYRFGCMVLKVWLGSCCIVCLVVVLCLWLV